MSRVNWVILLLLHEVSPLKAQKEDSSDSASEEWKPLKIVKECDVSKQQAPNEGNVGQSDLFPWLGIIKVHNHKAGLLQVALTGIVLVKRGHALGNADDISRIPKAVFKDHSSAMFVANTNDPWYCNVKDYMIHPEYDYATLNTIALVELDSSAGTFPMMPICWPSYSYNASRNLYAMGYQDDNKILEKKVFAMDYVDTTLCEEFYNRVGHRPPIIDARNFAGAEKMSLEEIQKYKSQDSEVSTAPAHLVCGFASRNRESCVWDNGMVLASNTTGTWMLLGLGVHGPGCAAPARFIEMLPYLPWIDSAMGLNEVEDQFGRRSNTAPIADPSPLVIDRPDRSTMYIRKADTEDICNSLHNELIFHQKRKLVASRQGRSVIYKISIQAHNTTNSFCCKVKLKDEQKDTSAIYNAENNAESKFKMTDEFKITIPADDPKIPKLDWEPWIKAEDLKDQQTSGQKTFDTFLRLEFEDEAEIEIEVFRPRQVLLASGITNASRRFETNEPRFDEDLRVKELRAFEEFSAEVRRRDAEVELKTNTSTEVNLKDNEKTILGSVEPYKKHNEPVYVDENHETTDKIKLMFNRPLDMDLDHYDAVRLPENKAAVIIDNSGENILDKEVLNNLTKTYFRDNGIKNIEDIIEGNTKHTQLENEMTEANNNKPVEIGITDKNESTSIRNDHHQTKIKYDITEKRTPGTMKSSVSDTIDPIHNSPKESALVKGLVSEAEVLKCILQLIFTEAFVLWIAIVM